MGNHLILQISEMGSDTGLYLLPFNPYLYLKKHVCICHLVYLFCIELSVKYEDYVLDPDNLSG